MLIYRTLKINWCYYTLYLVSINCFTLDNLSTQSKNELIYRTLKINSCYDTLYLVSINCFILDNLSTQIKNYPLRILLKMLIPMSVRWIPYILDIQSHISIRMSFILQFFLMESSVILYKFNKGYSIPAQEHLLHLWLRLR